MRIDYRVLHYHAVKVTAFHNAPMGHNQEKRMKKISMMAAVAFAVAVSAMNARIVTTEGDCSHPVSPNNGHGGIARLVQFFDGDDERYYYYWVYCDGTVEDVWEGQVVSGGDIGILPKTPDHYQFSGPIEQPNGGTIEYINESGTLVGKITFDGVPGHHAVLTLGGLS